MLGWIIPCDRMIVWVCMTRVCSAMIGIMALHNCAPIIANLCIHPVAVLKCPFNFTWFAKKSAIGGFCSDSVSIFRRRRCRRL